METKYDILVIGSEIPGLVSAALLAKHGFKVAIISADKGHGTYEKKGYLFNESPILMTGLHDGPLAKIFNEIGIPRKAPSNKDISYQVVLPDERVDIYRDPAEFRNELERCFPEDIDKINIFYEHISEVNDNIRQAVESDPFSFRLLLPQILRKGKMLTCKMMEELGLSKRFQSFIGVQLASFSYLKGPTPFTSASSLLESSRKGIYCIEGGKDGLRKKFFQKVEYLGADIVKGEANEVSRNGKRWLVRTEDEAISGRVVIGNMEVGSFCSLFLDIGKKCLAKTGKIIKSHYPLTINLGVKESGVPERIAGDVVVLREYGRDISFENSFSVHIGSATEGKKSIIITSQIPVEKCRNEEIRSVCEIVLKGVDWLFPFIEGHIDVMDTRYGKNCGSGLYTTALRPKMGMGILSYVLVRGEVLFAGPEVFPLLGFDGLIYSGEMAAKEAIKIISKSNDR